MKHILIVMGSVRSGRAADAVLSQVQDELKNYPNLEAAVVDFAKTPLPFFDADSSPATEGFVPTDKNVIAWTEQVNEADVVVVLTPEYNHSYTPVLKNAIDWVFGPWKDKPVAFIGYGWAGGSRAIKHLRDVFNSVIAAQPLETEANLRFTKEINLDGTAIDDQAAGAIKSVLDAVDALEI
jgi:NAD(P)H-dependent FMN reductase